MKRINSFPPAGARIATSVAIGLAATFLLACADDSTPTSLLPAVGPSTISRIPLDKQNRIVFMTNRDNLNAAGQCEIYSMLADGTGLIRLTTEGFDNQTPALSPDGKRVVFASNRDNGFYDIYVMNSDGSNVKRLTNTTVSNFKPTWSADGTKILFTSTRDAADPTARGVGASWEIYMMNADGSNVKRVTNNSFGEFDQQMSPDGTKIIFTSDRDHDAFWKRDLYVMNVDGTNIHRLTTQDGQLEAPMYDPSGTRIVYDIATAGGGIFVLSGHTTTQLRFSVGGPDFAPAWSPDGKQIAYTHYVAGYGSNVLKMDADGSNQKYLTRTTGNNLRPDWGR
jgi:TolB protein